MSRLWIRKYTTMFVSAAVLINSHFTRESLAKWIVQLILVTILIAHMDFSHYQKRPRYTATVLAIGGIVFVAGIACIFIFPEFEKFLESLTYQPS